MPPTTPCLLSLVAAGLGGALLGGACALVIARYAGLIQEGRCVSGATLRMALCSVFLPSRVLVSSNGRSMLVCSVVMAIVLAGLHASYGWGPAFCLHALAAVMLLLLAGIDARVWLLPDALTLPLMWLGFCVAWAGLGISLHDAVAGTALGFLFLTALAHGFRRLRGHDGMGGGDIKLLAALGAWVGWQSLAWVLLTASCLGIAYAMLRQRRFVPRGAYPFGPCLVLGGVAVFIEATAVHSWFSS